MTAKQTIESALLAALPPTIPPSFTTIDAAHFIGSGRHRLAVGSLTMFDGYTATVQCWQYGYISGCWAHKWLEMNGGDISWNGERWERVTK